MMKSISLIFFWIIVVNCVIICKADCDTGWFGSNCQYQCHCADGCDVNGFCKTQKCLSRWFGYKCQYQDFMSYARLPNGNSAINTNLWTDQDDSTCVFEGSIKQILVLLRYKSPFFFARLTVGDSGLISKYTVTLEDSSDIIVKRYPCRKQTFTVTNNRTVDIRCENTELVNRVILEGDGVTSICSIYVNGGRNVALKQPTEQTSTNGTNYARYAVDGTTGGTCTLTNNVTDVSPTWTLTFDEPMIVTLFEINSRTDSPMYQYFYYSRLQTVDRNNTTVYNYTIGSYSLSIPNINNTPLKKIQITATNSTYASTAILSICEIVAYGACQPGKWDLDCKQQCDSKCPDFCSEWDGSCPSFCLGYQAPGCSVECPSEKWGLNCMQDCSDRCQYKYCNDVDGLCTAGCNGYSDPPYCTKACVMGYYGLNCRRKCSPNCPNEECDQINGNCIQTCGPNHQGPFCEESSGIEKNKDTFSFDGASFGIGIGVSVGVVVLVLVFVVVKKRKKNTHDNSGVANTESTNMNQMRKGGETHGEPRADPNRYVQQPKSVTGPKDVLSTKAVHTKKALPPVPDDSSYEPIDMNQENESTYYNNHK